MLSSLEVMQQYSNTGRGMRRWGRDIYLSPLYPTHFLVVQQKEKMHLVHSKTDCVCNEGRTAKTSSSQAPLSRHQITAKQTAEAAEANFRVSSHLQGYHHQI